jgi:hypothetical protein
VIDFALSGCSRKHLDEVAGVHPRHGVDDGIAQNRQMIDETAMCLAKKLTLKLRF